MLSLFASDSLPVDSGISGWQAQDFLFTPVHNLLTFVLVLPWAIVTPIWLFSTIFIVGVPRIYRKLRQLWEGTSTPSDRLPTGVWTIHGRRYDLTPFLDQHPGGPWALQLGRNRDCTGLFESYHVFADMSKLEKIIARYELPESKAQSIDMKPTDNPVGLIFRDAFHEDVKQMARDHFKQAGISHKMKPWVLMCCIGIIMAEIGAAFLIIYGYRLGVVLMPLLGWLLTGNVAHEASHFALSKRPFFNSMFAFTSAPICFNATAWYIQHIVQHHVYTNDETDVDLYHFLPLCRTSAITKYVPHFRFQWASIWFGVPTAVSHILFVVPMDLLTGHIDPITKTKRYEQCENVSDLVAGAWYSFVLEFSLTMAWPMLVFYIHGLTKGFCWLAFVYSTASVLFVIFTQGAHLQERCMVEKEKEDFSWAKHQVHSSVNFLPDSFVWHYASGGLNMQALHHLLPSVSASHLRDLFPKFREVCAKHDVPVQEVSGVGEFFRGYLAWVTRLADEHIDLRKVEGKKSD